ncbi:MAG: hypothetical protein P8I83_03575 [Paracoccaceae bacterium]|nr:hypothetical protein [Paracoccaceae bacterium]
MKKPQKPVLITLEDEPSMPDPAEALIVRGTPLTTASVLSQDQHNNAPEALLVSSLDY